MELLSYTFVQYAFIGGLSLAVLTGLLGPFVVQSKQAFASDMFAHIALAGIGGALLFDLAPWWGALATLLVVSTLLWFLLESETYNPEALSMFFLSGGLALALVFVHLARDTVFSFENYLFGSILTLTSSEVVVMGILTCIVSALIILLWYPLIGATSNPQYLIPHKKTPSIVRLLYFWILAVVVWIGIRTIGGLLIGALLIIPTLSAQTWTHSFKQLTVSSVGISIFSVFTGLTLALYLDVPPTSLVIGSLFFCFILQLIFKEIYQG